MSVFVLDASVEASWIFDDEKTLEAHPTPEHMRRGEASVPALWHIDLRNGLFMAARRGRLPPGPPLERLDILRVLPIRTDSDPDLDAAFVLAEKHRLTFYDAIYLELAMRREAPLATLDRALARAAIGEKLESVVGPSAA